ncbi:hypothetical protein HDU78_001820 [Chytriomyces hyalinus]|nr:hypothetical protein HDU78_001820 [Chytriomyces hyalinus]
MTGNEWDELRNTRPEEHAYGKSRFALHAFERIFNSLLEPSFSTDSDSAPVSALHNALKAARSAAQPSLFSHQKDSLKELKSESHLLSTAINDTHQLFLNNAINIISLLADQLQRIRLDEMADHHSVYADYFSAIITNIHRKLQCLLLESELSVYGGNLGHSMADELLDLEKIRRDADAETTILDAQLGDYRGAGAEFNQLLGIYMRLAKDIKQVESDILRMTY